MIFYDPYGKDKNNIIKNSPEQEAEYINRKEYRIAMRSKYDKDVEKYKKLSKSKPHLERILRPSDFEEKYFL